MPYVLAEARNGTGKSINRRLPKAGTETSGCRASGGWELQ